MPGLLAGQPPVLLRVLVGQALQDVLDLLAAGSRPVDELGVDTSKVHDGPAAGCHLAGSFIVAP